MPVLSPRDRAILENAIGDSQDLAIPQDRPILIRRALRDYPYSSELDKALQNVKWGASSIVFADNLLTLLDDRLAGPSIPAFALLAQAIEPIAGEQKSKIAELRRRMGWRDFDPSEFSDNWQDRRSPVEIVERLIGENTLKPMFYLRRALLAAEAVVRIDLNSQPHGTGFLVAPNILMTNNHVIATEQQARASLFRFFYEEPDAETDPTPPRQQAIARAFSQNPLLYTNADKAMDFSLIRLEDPPRLSRYLPLRPALVKQDARVVIIQHPEGRTKHISLQNNLVAAADERVVQYYTSTESGSSGSPVFDDEFAVVAIHRGSSRRLDYEGEKIRITDVSQIADRQWRNQGTSMIAVLSDLQQNAPHLTKELRILLV